MAQPRSATDSALARVGERFVQALADQDAARLKAVVHDSVSFRAMTPGRFWEASDSVTVVDEVVLGTWFAPHRHVDEILFMDVDADGPMARVSYRFAVTLPDGKYEVEQQAYFETEAETITRLRIMCTGFVPRRSVET